MLEGFGEGHAKGSHGILDFMGDLVVGVSARFGLPRRGGIRILNGGREIPLDRIASPGIVCGGPFGNRQNVLLALALRRGNAFITGNPLNT